MNVYAARTDNPDAHNKLPQELGLEFVLVAREALEDITELGLTSHWRDEQYYSERNDKEDPAQALESYDNDQPTRDLAKHRFLRLPHLGHTPRG